MKDKILLLALLIFITTQAFAQANFGVRVGTSFSRLTPNGPYFYPAISDTKEQFLIGLEATIFFSIPLSERFFLQPEIHYLQKGEAYKGEIPLQTTNVPSFTAKTKRIYNFIEIPILLKGQLINGKNRLYLFGGPSLGYALSSQVKGDVIGTFYDRNQIALFAEGTIDWERENEIYNANAVRYDISGTIGTALEYNLGKISLILDLRYLHDFNDWKEYEGNSNLDKVQNRNLIVSLGLGF